MASLGAPLPVEVKRILLIGDASVGKTSLVERFVNNSFAEPPAMTSLTFLIKTIPMSERIVKMQLFHRSSEERFRAAEFSHYRQADAVMILCDVSIGVSFERLHGWLHNVDQHCPPGIPRMLVGNKIDKSTRQVSTKQLQQYASAHHMMMKEVSAKTGENVDTTFQDLLTAIEGEENDHRCMVL